MYSARFSDSRGRHFRQGDRNQAPASAFSAAHYSHSAGTKHDSLPVHMYLLLNHICSSKKIIENPLVATITNSEFFHSCRQLPRIGLNLLSVELCLALDVLQVHNRFKKSKPS